MRRLHELQRGSGPDSGRERSPSQSRILLVGILAAVVAVIVLATHWPALSAQALSFDDEAYLTENPLVRHPSWASARRFLGEVWAPSTVRGYYQPLTMISLMLDYASAERPDNLYPFHRTSLALHVANTVLIIIFLYMVFGNPWAAAIAGLLFGVHPLTVEPIPWTGERKTLLGAFFALASLIFYVRYARTTGWRAYAGCFVMYVLALMSKPTSTPLPVVMLLMDFWPLRRFGRRSLWEKVPLFVVGAVFGVITFISQKATSGATMPTRHSASYVPLVLCHNTIFYLYKIVRPVNLSSHYPFPDPLWLSDRMVLIGVIGTCLLVAALVLSLRWTRAPVTGWLIFFVAILPTMQIIGFSKVIASDKFAYLPSAGLLLVLAWGIDRLWSAASRSRRRTMIYGLTLAGVAGVASIEAVAARQHLAHWRDTEVLYRYMSSLAPRAPSLHHAMARLYLGQGRLDEAITELQRAIEQRTNDSELRANLGLALVQKGRIDEAIQQLARAVELNPGDATAHNNLGLALTKKGDAEGAIREFAEAVRIAPRQFLAQCNLGSLLLSRGQVDEAIGHFTKAVEANAGFVAARIGLADALRQKGDLTQAVAVCREALRMQPNNPAARLVLGVALEGQGHADEAILEYRQILQRDPSNAEARRRLTRLAK